MEQFLKNEHGSVLHLSSLIMNVKGLLALYLMFPITVKSTNKYIKGSTGNINIENESDT